MILFDIFTSTFGNERVNGVSYALPGIKVCPALAKHPADEPSCGWRTICVPEVNCCPTCRLNNPTATVYGFDANNTGHAVILTLDNPTANSAEKVSLIFLPCPFPACTHNACL